MKKGGCVEDGVEGEGGRETQRSVSGRVGLSFILLGDPYGLKMKDRLSPLNKPTPTQNFRHSRRKLLASPPIRRTDEAQSINVIIAISALGFATQSLSGFGPAILSLKGIKITSECTAIAKLIQVVDQNRVRSQLQFSVDGSLIGVQG